MKHLLHTFVTLPDGTGRLFGGKRLSSGSEHILVSLEKEGWYINQFYWNMDGDLDCLLLKPDSSKEVTN